MSEQTPQNPYDPTSPATPVQAESTAVQPALPSAAAPVAVAAKNGRTRRWVAGGALAAAGFVVGGALTLAVTAGATPATITTDGMGQGARGYGMGAPPQGGMGQAGGTGQQGAAPDGTQQGTDGTQPGATDPSAGASSLTVTG